MNRVQSALLGLVLFIASVALFGADITFPTLTGHVVDQAGLLESGVRTRLEQQLQAHEAASGHQVVVLTVNDVQGLTIEDYGYQLGRAWGIGQKDSNNGVILIVVPSLRQVRIEVGYGLEGVLTDAMASTIIQSIILPSFRQNHFSQGITDGAHAIIQALGGQLKLTVQTPKQRDRDALPWWVIFFLPILFLRRLGRGRFYGYRNGYYGGSLPMGGGFGGGGGFRGGGGSFGGGGASGGW
ncbi:MAG: TPM domain-containing protein [Gammaproteobacteria bacterium]